MASEVGAPHAAYLSAIQAQLAASCFSCLVRTLVRLMGVIKCCLETFSPGSGVSHARPRKQVLGARAMKGGGPHAAHVGASMGCWGGPWGLL